MTNERTETLRRDVREGDIRPVAGIWQCPTCHRVIQLMTESDVPQKVPFRCVCGVDMEPGPDEKEIDTNRPPEGH